MIRVPERVTQPELHYSQPRAIIRRVERESSALRILVVLETLASMEQPATLPDIVEHARLEKFKTYRALRTLQERGFVDHAPGSGYWIGSRSHALASLIGARPAVLRRARPVLGQLAELAGAGAALHLRSGSHRVLVCAVVPRRLSAELAAHRVPVGERAPLTTGCSGTAILAFLPDHEIEAVLASRPPNEPRPSRADLARVRADGYAMSMSDMASASRTFSASESSSEARIQLMSAPPQKVLPSPASTTTRTAGSWPRAVKASRSRAISSALKALRTAGRASVTRARPPSRVTRSTGSGTSGLVPRSAGGGLVESIS